MQQINSGGSSEVVDNDAIVNSEAPAEKQVSIREALGNPKITFVLGTPKIVKTVI